MNTTDVSWGIVSMILLITFALVKIIYDIIVARVKITEEKVEKHHDRIKDLEAFNTHKIDQLIVDFKEFKTLVKEKIHTDANFLNDAKNTLKRIEPILSQHEKMQEELEEVQKSLKKLESKVA